MSRRTIIIIRICGALAILGVLALGVLLAIFSQQDHTVQKADPEQVADPLVLAHTSNVAAERRNEDGTVSVEYSLFAQQYLTNDPGVFAPIDSSIIPSYRPEYDYENTTNVMHTYFSDDSSREDFIVHTVPGGRRVSFRYVGAQPGSWDVDGSMATFADLFPGVDAVYTIRNDALIEELVVRDEATALALGSVTQEIKLDGLYYKEQADGSITLHDAETRHGVFVIPAPLMYELDSSEPLMSDKLHYDIEEVDDTTIILHKVIDPKGKLWMQAAKYPIVVDNSYLGWFDNNMFGEARRSRPNGSSAYSYTFTSPGSDFNRTGTWRTDAPQSCSSCYSFWDYRYYYSFITGVNEMPGNYSFDTSQVIGGKLWLYGYRSGGVVNQVELPTNYVVNVYAGPNIWANISDPAALWGYTSVMNLTYQFPVTTLPNAATQNCYGNPSSCEIAIPLDISDLSLSKTPTGRTQFILEDTWNTYYQNGFLGMWTLRQFFTTAPPYPRLEIIYLPRPVIRVDPQAGTSTTSLEVQIDDDFTDETEYRLERSLAGSSGPWTQICASMSTGGSGSCGTGITYDCTGVTVAGTTGYCSIIDNLSQSSGLTQYSDRHVWYRARVQRTDPVPGESYVSSYSNVEHDYTLAALATSAPSVTVESWSSIKIWPASGMGDEYTNQRSYFASDAEPTKYCIGLYTIPGNPNWNYSPTSDIRYVDDPPSANSTVYTNFPSGTSNGRDLINNGTFPGDPRCLTFYQWVWFPSINPFYASGEWTDYAYLKPNSYYMIGTFSQNTRDNTVNDPGILNFAEIFTRARTPSAPNNPIGANNTSTTLQIALNTTPQSSPTTAPWTNPASTQYNIQIQQGGVWYYLPTAGGSSRLGAPQWGTSTDWNGTTGRTITGLSPATCYNFRAQSRNQSGVIGETAAAQWSNTAQYCTPLSPPSAPDVQCGYSTDIGVGYYCDVTLHDTANPSPPYFYKVQRSYNNSVWTNINGGTLTNGTPLTYINTYWSQTVQNNGTIRFRNLSCSAGVNRLYFRVFASISGSDSDTSISTASPVRVDVLPPCQPGQPTYAGPKGYDFINWNWTAPATIQAITDRDFYDFSLGLYANAGLANPWTQTGLLPNTAHRVMVRACDAGNANNGFVERCGQWSAYSIYNYTYAAPPNVDVSCDYGSALDDYFCRVTLTEASPPNPSSPITSYKVDHCNGTTAFDCEGFGATWASVVPPGYFAPTGWFSKNWNTEVTFTFSESNLSFQSFMSCQPDHTYQFFRVSVRNSNGEIEPLVIIGGPYDTLPPCQPQNLNHTNQNLTSLRWTWTAPSGGETVSQYTGSTSGCGTSTTPYTTPDAYRDQSGTQINALCTVEVGAQDARSRVGRKVSTSAYTSIQAVTDIKFNDVRTNEISIQANSSTGIFSNLGAGSAATGGPAGIRFRNNPVGPGGGGGTSFTSWANSVAATDSGLSANRNYCYQASSRNGNGDYNPLSPNNYQPVPAQCRYTLAAVPTAPLLIRAEDGTSANITVRTNDGNPQSSPATQYALCVTKYAADGTKEFERYARQNGSIDFSGPSFQCASGDDSGHWGTFDQWGDNNGVDIALDPSSKYDFALKARNGDGPIIESSGCEEGNTCIETTFGPKATLFLVRNNIVGWAWSSNLGWISTNCLNLYNVTGFGFSCSSAEDWGVNTYFEASRNINPVGGYAWASSGRTIPAQRWTDIAQVNTVQPAQTNSHTSADTNVFVDSFGRPHRIWAQAWPGSGDNQDIFYQRWNGREWVTAGGALGAENISQTVAASSQPTIAFDNDENPHIAWVEGTNVWVLHWNPTANNGFGGWVSPTGTLYQPGFTDVNTTRINVSSITGVGPVDGHPALVVDAANHDHVALAHLTGGVYSVYYTEWSGSDWTRSGGAAGYDDISGALTSVDPQPSLDVEQGSGYPFIVWSDAVNQILYRRWDGAAWTAATTVNGSTTNVQSPKIVVDHTNIPHIAWGSATGVRYIRWNATAGAWESIDGAMPAEISPNYNVELGTARTSIGLRVDAQRQPHLIGYASGNPQKIYYRTWDPAAKAAAGGWVTVSGATGAGLNDENVEVASRSAADIRGVTFDINGEGDPFVMWSENSGSSWDVFYRSWDSGYGESGAGWISFNTNVCANNTQKGCADNFDCSGAACIESAGTPPQTTDWTVEWADIGTALGSNEVQDFVYDDVSPGGPYFWVTFDTTADSIQQVRASDLTVVDTIDLNPYGADDVAGIELDTVTAGGPYLWVTAWESNQVLRIRIADQTVLSRTLSSCFNGGLGEYEADCNPNGIVFDPVTADVWVTNQEGGNLHGSISRIEPTTNTELNCDGTVPGGSPNHCGICSDPAHTTESACIAANPANNWWGVGNNPVSLQLDLTTQSLWTGDLNGRRFAKLDVTTGQVTELNLPAGYAYAIYGHARVGANLYVPLTSYSTHPLGEFGTGAIMIIDPVTATIIDVVDIGFPRYPQGIAYDGRYLWLSSWFTTGTCTNDATLYCSDGGDSNDGVCSGGTNNGASCYFDYGCPGGACIRPDCSSVGGGCSNSQTRVFQYEASSLKLVDSYEVSPTDWHRSYKVLFADDAIWVNSLVGYLAKISLGTSEGMGYGYCYDQAGASGKRYGQCSDGVGDCVADIDCAAGENCIYYTCANHADCPDYVPTGADEQCKAIATASFSGITREVSGWGRILSLKAAGEAQGFDDWGWIRLGGPYDDHRSQSGRYTLSGTEIDSQQFLGDPDVNPTDVQLYTLFGWGWQGMLMPSSRNNSVWLPHMNITETGRAADDTQRNFGSPSIVIDSIGDPHMAWSAYDATNASYDIYYARQKRGRWETITGTAYVPGTTDPLASGLNVSNANGTDVFWPSLQLNAADEPYLVWQQGGTYADGGEVYFMRWDSASSGWTTPEKIDDGGTPDLALDQAANPHVTYRHGTGANLHVFYRVRLAGAWVDPDGGTDDQQVDVGAVGGAAGFPKIAVTTGTPGIPRVVWVHGTGIYYRQWSAASSTWLTASGDGVANIAVNTGVTALPQISALDGQDPDIALYADGRPGIVWRDPNYVLYRQWDGSAWVSASGSAGVDFLWVNAATAGETERVAELHGAPSVVIGNDDQPHIVWSDDLAATDVGDVRYRHWDPVANGGQGAWVTGSGAYGSSGGPYNYDDQNLTVAATASGYSQSPVLGLDRMNNPHVAWNELVYAGACNPANGNADCGGAYPYCMTVPSTSVIYRCAASDVYYTKLAAGNTASGIGWIEFIPAGALLGIPYVQTSFGDVFAGDNIELAPPPAGTNQYTATYLIQANGDIQGITGNYTSSQSGLPTSSLDEPGLNPLLPGSEQPFGPNVLSRLDIDSLITADPVTSKDRFGYIVNTYAGGDLSDGSLLGMAPVLNNQVYHVTGDATIDHPMVITKGDIGTNTSGNGVIIIDGDLEINAPVTYDSTALGDITEMPSLAVIVRGNIYINSLVGEFAGVVVAIDPDLNDGNEEGIISTGRKVPLLYGVAAATDDTTVSSTYVNGVNSQQLQFGVDAGGVTHRAFLRWPIAIPAGSEIRRAYLRLSSDLVGSGNDFEGRIYLIDQDTVGAFAGAGQPIYDLPVSNSITFDTTDWNGVAIHESPDVTSLVQRFVDSDAYTPGAYLGLAFHEGQAQTGEFKQFYAQDHLSGSAAELVIEYAPQRTVYGVLAQADDVSAWGTNVGDWSAAPACMSAGWYSNNPNRVFMRFSPEPAGAGWTEIPENAEILRARMRVTGAACSAGAAFQLRQGLLNEADMPAIGANPYEYVLSQDVSEIADDLPATAWADGTVYQLADTRTLIQAWVDMTGYAPGNHLGIRLRRGGNETFAGVNEFRSLQPLLTKYDIDYRVPLRVSGLFIARGYHFDRKYTKNLEGAEQIVYDGRVVANTPPGLADFTKALPIYQRVVP